jgi:hypothetical protein
MLKNIKLKFKRLYNLNNRKGFKNLFKIIVNHIFEHFIAIGYIYKAELSDLKYIPENKDFEFRIMNEFDLDILQINYRKEFNEKIYLDLLSILNTPNVDGFTVKNREDICGYFFLAYHRSESEIEEKYFNVKKNGYLFSDYVFEKHRGKKIHQYSIYKRLWILKEKKYETATCIIERNNIPSIKSFEKFDFQRYLVKLFFRFGNNIRSRAIIKSYKKN